MTVLTNLIPDIYKAADIVGRELTGFTSSVMINANGSERAAKGQPIKSFFTRQATAVSPSPAMTPPEGTEQTVDNKTLTITKDRAVQIPWTGEEQRSISGSFGFSTIYGDQIRQAMRTLVNEVEIDLATEIYRNASRAVGTAGTTPFGSNFDVLAEARQILVDNGCPDDGMITSVFNTLAGTKLRNLATLQKANEAGGTDLLRQGTLLDLQGLMLKESAGVRTHTKGTGASYVTSGSTAVGAKDIALVTGTGTVLAGDVVTFAADTTNKYIVGTGVTAPGTISLNDTGARVVIPTANALTIGNSYTANCVFHRNAVELVMRAPAQPQGGDLATDIMTVQDPFSGLVFEIRFYKGYRKAMIEVAAVWGVKAWKPDFIATIMG